MLKIKDKIKIHDRKLKTNGFSGEIVGIEQTIENVKIYSVEVQLQNHKGNYVGKKIISLLEQQIERDV